MYQALNDLTAHRKPLGSMTPHYHNENEFVGSW